MSHGVPVYSPSLCWYAVILPGEWRQRQRVWTPWPRSNSTAQRTNKPEISNRKSNALTVAPPSHSNAVVYLLLQKGGGFLHFPPDPSHRHRFSPLPPCSPFLSEVGPRQIQPGAGSEVSSPAGLGGIIELCAFCLKICHLVVPMLTSLPRIN